MKKLILSMALLLTAIISNAQSDSISFDEINELLTKDSILRSFNYKTGRVIIGNNLATVDVPKGCLYLNPEESKYMMESIFGNPPAPISLGMLLSDTPSMLDGFNWIIDFNYVGDGHVDDEDAKDTDYEELLKLLIEQTDEASKERVAAGFEKVRMVGWAQPPFYDDKNKKLHWAKELAFGTDEGNTLNYNIRILGREGYLEMNIITGMDKLPEVKKDINMILASTNFIEGSRYADFNEDTDKMAEYGIGGLIVGGVLAKTGILAKIGIFLLKIIKPLIIGVIALFAFLGKKFFGKKKEEEEAAIEPVSDNEKTEE